MSDRLTLPGRADELWRCFIGRANKERLGAGDWERFYAFLYHCESYEVGLAPIQLENMLAEKGFPREHAEHVALVFSHGQQLLKYINEGYSHWTVACEEPS